MNSTIQYKANLSPTSNEKFELISVVDTEGKISTHVVEFETFISQEDAQAAARLLNSYQKQEANVKLKAELYWHQKSSQIFLKTI